MRQWIFLDNECCPDCGDDLKVIVDSEDQINGKQLYEDGAEVRCITCAFHSAISVDGDSGEIWLQY